MFEKKKVLPTDIKEIFPFASHYLTMPDGEWMHYIDEGSGPLLVMVHGNPTWSFLFRHLIAYFRRSHRVIVIDHVGMGLSSRPQNYPYNLRQHIKNLSTLLSFIGVGREIKSFNLLAHDWGGPIALGAAIELSASNDLSLIDQLFLSNTACFQSEMIPKRINILKSAFGQFLISSLNVFAYNATWMAPAKKLHPLIKKALLFPYQNKRERVAIAAFVNDIPLGPHHESFSPLKRIEEKLNTIKKDPALIWGMKDFCFNQKYLERWENFYPKAHVFKLKKASHYLFEDAPKEIIEAMEQVFAQTNGPSVSEQRPESEAESISLN